MAQLQSLLGIFLIPLLAIVFSENRTWLDAKTLTRLLIGGIGLQLALALLLLGLPASQVIFDIFSRAINALQQATEAGLRLVFGYLSGGAQPFDVSNPGAQYILAFRALPIILIMSVLSKLLYHWGILQKTVAGFSWALRRTFGVSGPLGTATAANIFVGMVEAPILIKPYLATMSRSALFATMTAGMATVAGTVLALYASILEPILPGAAGHLLLASVMSAPIQPCTLLVVAIAGWIQARGARGTTPQPMKSGRGSGRTGRACPATARSCGTRRWSRA